LVDLNIPKLCKAIKHARLALRFARTERRELARLVAGTHFSEQGAREKQPVNLLALYQWIIGRKLISAAPRFMLSTFNTQIKPVVAAVQQWGNEEIVRMNLANTLRRFVTDGLYSLATMKVAIMNPVDAAMCAWRLPAGSPSAKGIDFDDWVGDGHARDLTEMYFEGFRFRAPVQAVRECQEFNRKVRKSVEVQYDTAYNQEGDERISMIGRGYYGMNDEEYEDMCTCWEIYLPMHRKVVTLISDESGYPDGDADALHVADWIGSDNGPFVHMAYGLIPNNLLPLAPMMNLRDMHEAANFNLRKLMRVAERTKELTLYEQSMDKDATSIRDASDGMMVATKDPKNFTQIVFGGQHMAGLVAVANEFRNLFSYAAGNLDMAGGLAPQSKTLGQDKLLSAAGSDSIQSLQEDTVCATSDTIERLGWFWWHDPFKIQTVEHQVPGLPGISGTRRVFPNHPRFTDPKNKEFRGRPPLVRSGSFNDLSIKVDPYSLPHNTPESRMATMQSVMTNVVLPMMQFCVQQGIGLDMNKYLNKVGQYLNMPDLAEILTIIPPPEDASMGGAKSRTMPLSTERTVNRTSGSEATDRGQTKSMTTQLLSGKNQGGSPKASAPGFPAAA
jgi:hypothetical protein